MTPWRHLKTDPLHAVLIVVGCGGCGDAAEVAVFEPVDSPVEYSHSLTEQIGGQMAAGFTPTHLAEAPHHADATARYMPGFFATRAIRPS